MLGGIFDWVADQFRPFDPSAGFDVTQAFFERLWGTVGSDIKDYVRATVKFWFYKAIDAIGWVETGLNFGHRLLGDLVLVVRVLAQAAFDGMTDIVVNKLPDLASFIFRVMRTVTDPLLGRILALGDLVRSGFDIIGAVFHNFQDWVIHTALAEIWDWIHGAFNWVYHNMILPLAAVFQRLYDELKAWANMAWGYISEAWNWVTQHGLAIADLIYRASAWLIWMAGHSFSALLQLWQDAISWSPSSFVDTMLRAAQSEGGVVDEWVARFLGQ